VVLLSRGKKKRSEGEKGLARKKKADEKEFLRHHGRSIRMKEKEGSRGLTPNCRSQLNLRERDARNAADRAGRALTFEAFERPILSHKEKPLKEQTGGERDTALLPQEKWPVLVERSALRRGARESGKFCWLARQSASLRLFFEGGIGGARVSGR